jgi:hypothetical protein
MASTSIIVPQPWNGGVISQPNDINDLGISEQIQKIARKELREDENSREQNLQQLRDWIKQNPDIQNIRNDDRFLLRFLRAKKFSVPMAQQCLLKYLNLKRIFPQMTSNLDFLAPAVNQLITNGYIFASPIRDRNGRRVIIAFAKNFDPNMNCSADMAKAHLLTYEALLEDPENQVLGFVHVGDMSGITTAHITCWNPNEFARIIKWGEQSVPMRHKEIHFVNVPATVKYVLDFAKTRVSNKIKDRLSIHVNPSDLITKIEPACLPKELGGTMPMAEMIDLWKRELTVKRDLLIALDQMKILNDQGIVRNDRNNSSYSSTGSIEGSFRKLEVD